MTAQTIDSAELSILEGYCPGFVRCLRSYKRHGKLPPGSQDKIVRALQRSAGETSNDTEWVTPEVAERFFNLIGIPDSWQSNATFQQLMFPQFCAERQKYKRAMMFVLGVRFLEFMSLS